MTEYSPVRFAAPTGPRWIIAGSAGIMLLILFIPAASLVFAPGRSPAIYQSGYRYMKAAERGREGADCATPDCHKSAVVELRQNWRRAGRQ